MHPTPTDLARARAAVADPQSVRCHPALMQCAWATLKQARGQSVDYTHLHPAHIITAPRAMASRQMNTVEYIDAARDRIGPAVRARMAFRTAQRDHPNAHPHAHPNGGDAA